MPRGFSGVRAASDDINARKAAGGGGSGRLYFALKDRDSVVVRFLEEGDEVNFAWKHKTPVTSEKKYGGWVVCRDQDETGASIGEECPGCDRDLKKQFRGLINLIWRDAPVYERDENGRLKRDRNNEKIVIDHKDQVAVWDAGIMVFEDLNGLDIAYKGLTNRDFRVTRKGADKTTRYDIFPADPDGGPQPMSANDKALAAEKYDLEEDVTPPSVEDYWEDKYSSKKSDGVGSVSEISQSSPFRRKAAA